MEFSGELLKIVGKRGAKKIFKHITMKNIELIIWEYNKIIKDVEYKEVLHIEEKFLYDIDNKNKINNISPNEYANLLRYFSTDFTQIAYVIQNNPKLREQVAKLEDKLCDQPFYINILYKKVKKIMLQLL